MSHIHIMFLIFQNAWVWTASLLAFIIPTISILAIWILIAVHLTYYVDTTDPKGRKSFKRVTAIMGTLTIGMILNNSDFSY